MPCRLIGGDGSGIGRDRARPKEPLPHGYPRHRSSRCPEGSRAQRSRDPEPPDPATGGWLRGQPSRWRCVVERGGAVGHRLRVALARTLPSRSPATVLQHRVRPPTSDRYTGLPVIRPASSDTAQTVHGSRHAERHGTAVPLAKRGRGRRPQGARLPVRLTVQTCS